MQRVAHSQFDDFSHMGSTGMRRRTTSETDTTLHNTSTNCPEDTADLRGATPLCDFKSVDDDLEQQLTRTPSYLSATQAGNANLNTEEFCTLLRQETYDIDECIFEAASWQQQRKFQDWVEDVVDDMKEKGLLRKPGAFEYTLFTVSTIGAVAGWIAGGPLGSIVGSKTATVAVGAGFAVKEMAETYVQKVVKKEQPVPVFELSQNAAGDSLLAGADPGSEDKVSMTKFELDQRPADPLSARSYQAAT